MEPRKIIKFGNSSFVVTLPNVWLEKNSLKKGDSINMTQTDTSIIFRSRIENPDKRATISLDDKPLKLFNKELISFYLKNFKYITITGKDIMDKMNQFKVLQEKLSSVEIVEISADSITLKDLTAPSELNLKNLISEIIKMEKIIFDEIMRSDSNRTSQEKYHFITQLDSNINKLTFLSYKAINYNLDNIVDRNQVKDSIHYWRMISSFEQIGDILKRLVRYMKNDNSENMKEIFEVTLDLKSYFDFATNLLNEDINLDKNLTLYLDKKQSLLREFESLRTSLKNNMNLFLVISQLFKDILGQIDTVVLSVVDIKNKQ